MDLCLVPSDFDGPGCYRVLFPGRELQRRGHLVCLPQYGMTRNPKTGDTVLMWDAEKTGIPDASLYVVQGSNVAGWRFRMHDLRAIGRKIVYEVDDSHQYFPVWHPAFNTDWGEYHRSLQQADAVSVSTPALAEEYSALHDCITVLPNFLDWSLWENVTPQYEVERRRVRIGYMGAMNFHAWDVGILRGVIGPFLERHPEVEFVAAGDGRQHDFLGVPVGQRVTTDKVSFHERSLPDITATFDIGLVPLADHPFNEAKSYLKGLEYAACGIPVVASPTEQYRGFVRVGVDGFLARKPGDWVRALEELVSDASLRERMGAAARLKAQTMTIQEHAGLWESFYGGVLDGRIGTDRFPAIPDRVVRGVPPVSGGHQAVGASGRLGREPGGSWPGTEPTGRPRGWRVAASR